MEPSPDPDTDPVLGEGHYTVVLAGVGHRTLEVTTAGAEFRAGPLIVSYLCGPDNERDYRAFAHITAEGAGRRSTSLGRLLRGASFCHEGQRTSSSPLSRRDS